jgi:hypothetical protein
MLRWNPLWAPSDTPVVYSYILTLLLKYILLEITRVTEIDWRGRQANRAPTHLKQLKDARPRYADRNRMLVVASAPREGRVARQCRRCFIANEFRPVSMTQLREWCYPARPLQHWFYINIKRGLARLGARQIGRAGGRARPAVYALKSK